MPRTASDLTSVTIYCLESIDGLHQYVGSTNNLHSRKIHHKYRCHNINGDKYNFKVYQTIRDNGGLDNFCYRVLEQRGFATNREKLKRESYYIKLLNSDMNTYINY
jgi:hypothetical protein